MTPSQATDLGATDVTAPAYFTELADVVCQSGTGIDRCTLWLAAESSQFIRFNRGAVRQATQVEQAHATVAVVRQARRMESRVSLSGNVAADCQRLLAERAELVDALAHIPDDPYLLLPGSPTHSHRHDRGELPPPGALVREVSEAARGLDFVGFYAGGPVVRAFADSLGSRHWHHVQAFHLEWCLYLQADRAVKCSYAGSHWDTAEFARRMAEAASRLPLLGLSPKSLTPGAYRAYFAPEAMAELLTVLGWSGFGLKEQRTGTSSLARLAAGDAALHPAICLSEDTVRGLSPAFTPEGFVRPATVPLVTAGRVAGTLNSPRSAREFGVEANGANEREAPESLHLAAGDLPATTALEALGTGLLVTNLWYLNYSDRLACRMTGMTRFACLWVENGRPVAPLGVMRFDDSFLRMFGAGLLALTRETEQIVDGSTYQARQLGAIATPGALVEGWRLTL